MLLQGYDFYELYRRQGCRLQCGASDQWGNIVSGVDLVRRLAGDTVHGLTFPLVLDSQGKKFGKTEKGAVYLDPAMTSPYDFYQFWLNVADADVGRFLRWLTFLPREEIEALEARPPEQRWPQQALAAKLTERVHGAVALQQAIADTKRLFHTGREIYGEDKTVELTGVEAKATAGSLAPGITVARSRLEGEGLLVVDLLVELGACASKSDARRQLEQGGISVNEKPLGSVGPNVRITAADVHDGQVVIQRGKKHKYVVTVE
jgi:tyrosyl-tRNA synthetase